MPYLWKTLKDGLTSEHGDVTWVRWEWQTVNGPLVLCERGFHASPRIIDAMGYVTPDIIAQVEVRGEHLEDGDKQCWTGMRVVEVYPWSTTDSVALAIYAAELVLELFESRFPTDQRPREAIEAAKACLKKPSVEAARAAARAARAEKILDQCEAFILERLGISSRLRRDV